MEEKYNQLKIVSSPDKVFKIAMDNGYKIGISNLKNKKYKILNPNTNKFIHFGDLRYADYLFHQDEKRRDSFLKRNWRWASADDYTPAYFSYYLLW